MRSNNNNHNHNRCSKTLGGVGLSEEGKFRNFQISDGVSPFLAEREHQAVSAMTESAVRTTLLRCVVNACVCVRVRACSSK